MTGTDSEKPDIVIVQPDPVTGGKYLVRCRCGRGFDAYVDRIPYVQCPGCKTVVDSAEIKEWHKDERWNN